MAEVKIIRGLYIKVGDEESGVLSIGEWYKKTDILKAEAERDKLNEMSANYGTTYESYIAEFVGWEERDLDTGD